MQPLKAGWLVYVGPGLTQKTLNFFHIIHVIILHDSDKTELMPSFT